MRTKCKRGLACLTALLLLAAMCFHAPPGTADVAGEPAIDEPVADITQILVIYPEEADLNREEDNLSAIAQVLLSLQLKADYVEWRKAEKLNRYDYIIWCDTVRSYPMDTGMLEDFEGRILSLGRGAAWDGRNGSIPAADNVSIGVASYQFPEGGTYSTSVSLLSPARMEEPVYSAGLIETAEETLPLVCANDRVRCISLVDYTSAFAKAVLTQETAHWLWPYDSRMHTYTEYVVLDHIYPFADPYRLQNIVQYLADRKMAFVISVMPIYEHADYPAMNTFCEVLRYAQKCGGSVILCAPLMQGNLNTETLLEKLTLATCNYVDQGVYPLALEIPCNWVLQEDLRGILKRYRTLFFTDMESMAGYPVSTYALQTYLKHGIQQITPALKLDETGISQIARCSTALYIDFASTEDEQILASINAVKNSPIPVQDLWDMTAFSYLAEEHTITWDQNTLMVDGEQHFRQEDFEKPDTPFDYKRDVYYRVIADLSNQNYLLIGISAVLLILFALLGMSSRRQMHKRFLKPKPRQHLQFLTRKEGGDRHADR